MLQFKGSQCICDRCGIIHQTNDDVVMTDEDRGCPSVKQIDICRIDACNRKEPSVVMNSVKLFLG